MHWELVESKNLWPKNQWKIESPVRKQALLCESLSEELCLFPRREEKVLASIYANYVIAEDLGKATGGPMLNKIVRVIAQEGKPMESSEIARKVGKPQNYMQSYLRHLSDYDVITRVDRGVYKLVDNVVSQCIAKNSI